MWWLRVAYPFWLGGTHPPDCGYRAFQVTCSGAGKAFLQNSFWKYQIVDIDISYQDSSFLVSNVDLSDGTCEIELRVNASSDLGLTAFGISAANQQLFFLYNYNCAALHKQPAPPV